MKLYYEHDDTLEYIGDFNTIQEAIDEIFDFWRKLSYTPPYIRIIPHLEYTSLDIGFHTRFYKFYNDGYIPTGVIVIERRHQDD